MSCKQKVAFQFKSLQNTTDRQAEGEKETASRDKNGKDGPSPSGPDGGV